MNLEQIMQEAQSFFKPTNVLFPRSQLIEFAKHCVEKSQQWRPISEAPKDGTVVLLFGKWAGEIHGPNAKPSIDIGFWQGGKSDYQGDDWWSLTTGDAYACWMNATHWKPLPLPPAPEAA